MADELIRSFVALYPRGTTNDQLIWRLRTSGIQVNAADLLASLVRLSAEGLIRTDGCGRWHAARLDASPPAQVPGIAGPVSSQVLSAVPAGLRPVPVTETTILSDGPAGPLPAWESLLRYHAATQRQDPRGRIETFPDRHGTQWQLLAPDGRWWQEAELAVPVNSLPGTLREALSGRRESGAALGWPILVQSGPDGVRCMPALIVPVTWRLSATELVLRVDGAPRPVANPAFLQAVAGVKPASRQDIEDRLFPEGEPDGLGDVAVRLGHVFATLAGAVLPPEDPGRSLATSPNGLRNALALFLPDDARFTQGTAADLETLATWEPERRSGTALSALLEGTSVQPLKVPLLAPSLLTDSQERAASAALGGPVTVIQGPPGTGKSEVIVALIVSAVMAGRSVLFAARNHQAIDEVERRFKPLIGEAPLFVRARDAEGERDTNLVDQLRAVATLPPLVESTDGGASAAAARAALAARGAREARIREALCKRTAAHLELSDLADQHALILAALGPRRPEPRPRGVLGRIGAVLAALVGLRPPAPRDDTLARIKARIAELRDRIAAPIEPPDPTLAEDVGHHLPDLARRIAAPTTQEQTRLADLWKEIDFRGTSARRIDEATARSVLAHRPVWAVSTLSAPNRIPLLPALFDYAIFDEASQADIASALPLMARARAAVVVGDPEQLSFVPQLGRETEHALMDAAGLPAVGRAPLAQSRNSLFDFARRFAGTESRFFLADQFRSDPAIVDYLNGEFYVGKLRAQGPRSGARPPDGYRPGLAWEDVTGQVRQQDGGSCNPGEARRIAEIVARLADDPGFVGTVGVVSLFNAQVACLMREVGKGVPKHAQDRLKLRIATVDKWQGGEADVILFSVVIAPGAPHSARLFLDRERRRLNVAVSRARALCLVVGDLTHARTSGIRHLARLAERATTPPRSGREPFDSRWERRLDAAMRARGLSPLPQYPVGRRYLDFALDPEGRKLDIEVDGARWHLDADGERKVPDRLRDAELTARGWRVLRFWVHELERDMEGCLDRIERELRG